MTSFVLKIIGIITMLCDHIGIVFFKSNSILCYIGRIAFPIFAFQIAQGYIHTKDIKKYILRLFFFACISQIPFYLFTSIYSREYTLNIFFTLLLGLIAILSYDKIKNKYLSLFIVFMLCILAQISHVDYGAYGVACVFLFYIFYNIYSCNKDCEISKKQSILYKGLMCLSFIFLTLVKYSYYIIENPSLAIIYLKFFLFTCLSLIPICLYNDKHGIKLKYLFYIFYPLHLLIIYLVHLYIFS